MGDIVPFPTGPRRQRPGRREGQPPRTFTVRRQPGGTWAAFLDADVDELGMVRTLLGGWDSVEQIEKEWQATVRWEPEQRDLFEAEFGPRIIR